MAMAGKAVTHNSRRCDLPPSHPRCWSLSLPKPNGLKAILQRAMTALRQPEPITFRHQHGHKHWRLTTDASNHGWGAVLESKEAASPQWTQAMTMQNVWNHKKPPHTSPSKKLWPLQKPSTSSCPGSIKEITCSSGQMHHPAIGAGSTAARIKQ